jgi:hypothetical protein
MTLNYIGLIKLCQIIIEPYHIETLNQIINYET